MIGKSLRFHEGRLKIRTWKFTVVFLLVLLNHELTANANASEIESSTMTHQNLGNETSLEEPPKNVTLRFEPKEILIEETMTDSFLLLLDASTHKNEEITIEFKKDNPGIVVFSSDNITLNFTGKDASTRVNFTARQRGQVVITASASTEDIDLEDLMVIRVYSSQILEIFTQIVGWTYFVFWTVAWYPQIYINFKSKSVIGLDFNFVALNFLGHFSYNVFNCALYFSPVIQEQYKKANPPGLIPVQINDVGFSIHSLLCMIITVLQVLIFERGDQRISYICVALLAAMVSVIGVTLTLAILNVITWLNFVDYFSYIKLAVTIFKNCPQVYLNYKRQSTDGWSICTVLMDISGGALSVMQMFMIAINFNDWSSIYGDLSKLGLGLLSVLFDIVYIVQHYIMYRPRYRKSASIARAFSESSIKSISGSFP